MPGTVLRNHQAKGMIIYWKSSRKVFDYASKSQSRPAIFWEANIDKF